MPDLRAWVRRPVTKVLAVGDGRRADGACLAAGRGPTSPGRAEVTVSHPRVPRVPRARASRRARRSAGSRAGCGIPLGRRWPIGDQYNDLEMIAGSGHGVAMPSAPAEVQAAARYVAAAGRRGGRRRRSIEALVLRPAGRARRSQRGRAAARARTSRSGGRRSMSAAGPARRSPATTRPGGGDRGAPRGRPGGLPTDTVYGLAVALDAPDGIERLFAAKGRPPDKAIVLLVADLDQAERIGVLGAGRARPRASVLAGRR